MLRRYLKYPAATRHHSATHRRGGKQSNVQKAGFSVHKTDVELLTNLPMRVVISELHMSHHVKFERCFVVDSTLGHSSPGS